MALFYSITGLIICFIAILTFRLSFSVTEKREDVRVAIKVLATVYFLSGLSVIVAQLEPRLTEDEFELLNPLMLLFFYLISHGFIYVILVLYEATVEELRNFRRGVWLVLGVFGVYTIVYFAIGDEIIYLRDEMMSRLENSPVFMFRCALLIVVLASLIYNVKKCYRQSHQYIKRTVESFSEIDFQQNIVLMKFMWSLKALAVWVLMTYFYATSVLEIISCTLMALVFALQYNSLQSHIKYINLLSFAELVVVKQEEKSVVCPEDAVIHQRIAAWEARVDKPFTRNGLTILDVAREIGVSKKRLSQYINHQNINFCSWINTQRINEACRMIATQHQLSLSEIAEEVGFCDLPAFSRAFKKATGVSPKTFRENSSPKSK